VIPGATHPEIAVVRFGERRVPRALRDITAATVTTPADIDAATQARRVVVVGDDTDLAAVLTRLLRTERLDVELAYVPRRRTAATRAYQLPTGWRAARRARTGTAQRVPLIRDDGGHALVGAALWVGTTDLQRGKPSASLHGEAVVDDTVLFDGETTAVRIEPTATQPGLRAATLSRRMRPRRWVSGRAAQLGTTGAFVVRDGESITRSLRRSTFYRHTTGWLAVR
jgi:hypothetical protein